MLEERDKDEPLSLRSERPPTVAAHTALFHQALLLAGFPHDPMRALRPLFVAFSNFARIVVGGKDRFFVPG